MKIRVELFRVFPLNVFVEIVKMLEILFFVSCRIVGFVNQYLLSTKIYL